MHRALKNAVNAGLLRHRSGRYKVLATLSPTSDSSVPSVSKEAAGSSRKTDDKTPKSDALSTVAPIGGRTETPRRKQERKKRTASQQQSSKSRSSGVRKRTRRSPQKRTNTINRKRRQRKRSYEDEFEDQSSGQYVSYNRDVESPLNRRTKRPRLSRRESDFSDDDESDRESYVSRKRASRANKSIVNKSLYRDKKPKEARAKSRNRSASRVRSPQPSQRKDVQARQYPVEEVGNDRQQQHDEDRGSAERDATRQETLEDVEGGREPNDSNSGSTLDNS